MKHWRWAVAASLAAALVIWALKPATGAAPPLEKVKWVHARIQV